MSKATLGSCEGCEYFEKIEKPVVGSDMSGYCHAGPPQLVVFPDRTGRVILKAMFPPVKTHEWCGAFNPPHEMRS